MYDNILYQILEGHMDLSGDFEKVFTDTITWIVTGVLGSIVVAGIPGLRKWFSERPWAVSCAVAFLTSGLVAAAMWTALKPSSAPTSIKIGVHRFGGLAKGTDEGDYTEANNGALGCVEIHLEWMTAVAR